MKLAVVVGSLHRASINRVLAEALVARLPTDATVTWVDVDLPLFCQDLEADVPAVVLQSRDQVLAGEGVLIVSPEYNRSISGVLKNWIDWMSRESTGYPLDSKRAVIAGASTGQIGTAVMQSHLRPVLAHLGVDVMAQPAMMMSVPSRMAADGTMPEATAAKADQFMAALQAHIERR